MTETIFASQLIYTSWPNGNSMKKGFMVYSKTEDITAEEENEILASFRYVTPRGLPFAPTEEQIKTLFPPMYGCCKLTSGRYVIALSTYIGQDYTKRYGNYLIHAFVMNEYLPSLVLSFYNSPRFRRCLTKEELSAPSAPASLEKVKLDVVPTTLQNCPYDKKRMACYLDIIKSSLKENKKVNLFLDLNKEKDLLKYLYFALDEKDQKKVFFSTYSATDGKLFNVLARPMESFSSYSSNLNPLILNVSKDNCLTILGKQPSFYSSFVSDILSTNPNSLPTLNKELSSYVENGLVKDFDSAVLFKQAKNGNFDGLLSYPQLCSFLPSLKKICSPLILEKAFYHSLNSFPSQKKKILEDFFPLLSTSYKEKIVNLYLQYGYFSSGISFLRIALQSPVKDYSLSLFLSSIKNNPSLVDDEEKAPLFSLLLTEWKEEDSYFVLSLLFERLFFIDQGLFERRYLPSFEEGLRRNPSFASSLYAKNEKREMTSQKREFFNKLFYKYLSKQERDSLLALCFEERLNDKRNLTLDSLLSTGFSSREDGFSLLVRNLPSYIRKYSHLHPSLILELELFAYQKGDASYYNEIQNSYFASLKENSYPIFLNLVKNDVDLKRKLYFSVLASKEVLDKNFALPPKNQFEYLSLIVSDPQLCNLEYFWKMFFFVKGEFVNNSATLESLILEKLSNDSSFREKVKASSEKFEEAQSYFKRLQCNEFEKKTISNLQDLLRVERNLLCDSINDAKGKKKIIEITILKMEKILSQGKNDLRDILRFYLGLKNDIDDTFRYQRFLKDLSGVFEKSTMSEMKKEIGLESSFSTLVKDYQDHAMISPKLFMVRDGLLFSSERNEEEIIRYYRAKEFLFLQYNAFLPYCDEFCSLFLEGILHFHFILLSNGSCSVDDVLSCTSYPFLTYKKYAKAFSEVSKKVSNINLYYMNMISYFLNKNNLMDKEKNFFSVIQNSLSDMDKKSRALLFENMRKTNKKELVEFIEKYEEEHTSFFVRLFRNKKEK